MKRKCGNCGSYGQIGLCGFNRGLCEKCWDDGVMPFDYGDEDGWHRCSEEGSK